MGAPKDTDMTYGFRKWGKAAKVHDDDVNDDDIDDNDDDDKNLVTCSYIVILASLYT